MSKVTKASLAFFESLKDFAFHKLKSTKTFSFCCKQNRKKNHENFGGLPCYFTKLVSMCKTVSYSEIVLGYISFIWFTLVLLYTLSPICSHKKTENLAYNFIFQQK